MSRIRAKDTGIERQVFHHLRQRKIYFQRHYVKAPGKPDIALPSKKIAIFVDGDFWHGYRFNSWKSRVPKVYWQEKIAANITRDQKNRRKLRRAGWKVLRIWGHELREKPDATLKKIEAFLKQKARK